MAELDHTAIAATSIATPAAGVAATFVETVDKRLKTKDDTGFVTSYKSNGSSAALVVTASTRTYITGSAVSVGSQKLQVGSRFRWRFAMTKTAAGTATSAIDIAVGTAGTTADTARVSFTKPAGTAAVDEGFVEIECNVNSIGAAGVLSAEFIMSHNGNTVGHMTIPNAVLTLNSSGFDMTVANLIVGVCITTGASDAVTIALVNTEAWNV